MANPLSWVFKLFDGISRPAKAMSGATSAVTVEMLKASIAMKKAELEAPRLARELDKLNKEMNPERPRRFSLEWGNAFKSFAGIRKNEKGGWIFNVAEGAERAVRGVELVSDAIGHVLDVVGQREQSKDSLASFLGETEASRILDYLDAIGEKTAFLRPQVRGVAEGLAEFYKGFDLQRTLVASLDVGGKSIERTARAVEVFRKLGATGHIESEAFAQLGLVDTDVYDRIAKLLKITDTKQSDRIQKVKQAITGGKVDRGAFLGSVLGAIADKEGGMLGGKTLGASTSLVATMNKLRGFPDDMIERLLGRPEVVASIEKMLDRALVQVQRFGDYLAANPDLIDRIVAKFEKLVPLVERLVDATIGVASYIADPAGASHEGALAGQTRAKGPGGLMLNISGDNQADLLQRAGLPWYHRLANAMAMGQPYYKQVALAQAQKEMGGEPMASLPQAHDFIWRAGRMIRFDSEDTIVGAKGARGLALAADDAGGAFGGGGRGGGMVQVNLGGIVVQLGAERGDARAVGEAVGDELEPRLRAMLHGLVQQLAATTGS